MSSRQFETGKKDGVGEINMGMMETKGGNWSWDVTEITKTHLNTGKKRREKRNT